MTGPNWDFFRAGRPNLDDDLWLRGAVAWFPLVAVIFTLSLKVFTPALYSRLTREDGVVEWGTALAFTAAGVFAAVLAARLRHDCQPMMAALYAGLAAGMLFATFEEISWGQRILNVEAPEFFLEHSTKEEMNIHNLEGFPLGWAFIIVGFYGAFSRSFAAGWLRRKFPLEVDLLTPRSVISAYFLVTFVLYAYFEYMYYTVIRPLGITVRREYDWAGHFIIGKDQEATELLLAIGFLLFAFDNWQRHKAVRIPAAGVGPRPADRRG